MNAPQTDTAFVNDLSSATAAIVESEV